MNIDIIMQYEQKESTSLIYSRSKLGLSLDALQFQFPKSVYSLELGDGVVADNTNEEWNGFSYPSFSKTQCDNLLLMLNKIPELKTELRNNDLVIYNDASGENEIIECRNNTYEFPGWCFFKFGEDEIKARINNLNWDVDDVANFFLWLNANSNVIECESLAEGQAQEFEFLSCLAIESIKKCLDGSMLALIDKHDTLKSLFN